MERRFSGGMGAVRIWGILPVVDAFLIGVLLLQLVTKGCELIVVEPNVRGVPWLLKCRAPAAVTGRRSCLAVPMS